MDIAQETNSRFTKTKFSSSDDLIQLSDAYLAEGRYEEACSKLNEALVCGGREIEVYNRFGYIKYCLREYHAALECYQLALEMCADNAELNNNLGLLYWAVGELDLAEKYFTKANEHPEPYFDAALNLSRLALARESYKSGWGYYRFHRASLNANISSSRELQGKSVLIYGEVKTGQELFFLRFLNALKKLKANTVSYYAGDNFHAMSKQGIEGITFLRTLPVEAHYDVALSIFELPVILSETQSLSFLKPASFGRPIASSLRIVKNLLPNNGRENIAVSWESFNPDSNGLKMRISPELLGETLRYSNANILVLQKKATPGDIRLLEKGLRRKVFNYGFMHDSLDESYAFLSEMDHFISVGDRNIHLVSGLDIKVSVMLSHPPQWHWLVEGSQTPWFPDFLLYRQDASGSWEQACQALKLTICD